MKIYTFEAIIDSCNYKHHTLSKREAVKIRAQLKREHKDEIEYLGKICCDEVETTGKGLVRYLNIVFSDY